MIEVHIPALEAFLYVLCLILVLFALGYISSIFDRTKGFTKEEAKKTEEQIRKMIGEVYGEVKGEVKDDSAHSITLDGIQLNSEDAHTRSTR